MLFFASGGFPGDLRRACAQVVQGVSRGLPAADGARAWRAVPSRMLAAICREFGRGGEGLEDPCLVRKRDNLLFEGGTQCKYTHTHTHTYTLVCISRM